MDKILLFDLGGVLVDVVSVDRLTAILDDKKSREEVAQLWVNSKYLRLFESGMCTKEQFANGAIEELGLPLSASTFLQEFAQFTSSLYSGVEKLLRKLMRKHTLACLSDTNALQWQVMCEKMELETYFKYIFLSFEIGKLKPDEAVYAHVLQTLQCDPAQIYYFDDRAANVKAGAAAGMNAFQVEGAEMLAETLLSLGLV